METVEILEIDGEFFVDKVSTETANMGSIVTVRKNIAVLKTYEDALTEKRKYFEGEKMDRTPGYWHWHDAFGRKDGKGDPIGTGRGLTGDEPAVGSCSRFSFAVSDDDGFVVARCSNALVTMSKERSEANARLCAGAPEMELMLRRIAEKVLRVTEKHYIGGIVRVEDRNELHGMAREAGELLAKVRG